jgi:phage shock protein PspC (stress-responsive transcriptional regulator)
MLMNRRLYRSRTDTIIGGVAAGVANYLNTDSALVRIAWAILVPLTGGAALIAYIVAWIVVPEEARLAQDPQDPGAGQTLATSEPARDDGRTGMVVGIGLVLIGLWFLLREYLPDFDWGLLWPLVVIGAGVLILATSMRRRR